MGSRRNHRHGQHGHSSRNETSRQQNQSGNPIAPAPERQSEAAQSETESGKNQPTKNYDRRIANWTAVVGAFTIVLAIATAASGYILWKTDTTLQETLQQNRDALVIQQRAFMTAKEIQFEPLTIFGIKGTTWLANVFWENSGKTPTKNLTIIAHCVSGFEQLVDPANIPKGKQDTTFRMATITKAVFGPKQINRAGFCGVTSLDALLGQFGAFTHLYVYGTAIYHDIFDLGGLRNSAFRQEILSSAAPIATQP